MGPIHKGQNGHEVALAMSRAAARLGADLHEPSHDRENEEMYKHLVQGARESVMGERAAMVTG